MTDVTIVGAGAAGMLCALQASIRGRNVTIIDHNTRPGEKILISGGGRCNFTNMFSTHENFISANPDFCRSALSQFPPAGVIAMVERQGIAYHEKHHGQLFCDGSARQIVDMLVNRCRQAGVTFRMGTGVRGISRGTAFNIETSDGLLESSSLVIATGGLSVPKLGATDFGYRVAEQFGHTVVMPRPGLVPLTFDTAGTKFFGELAGVSLEALVSVGKTSFLDSLLFTHRGVSGPGILQISSYLQEGETLSVDLMPRVDVVKELRNDTTPGMTVEQWLQRHLPKRFVRSWCRGRVPDRPVSQCSNAILQEVARQLKQWEITPTGSEGFQKAEVTVGGIDTEGLSSKTLESRHVSGLFFIGEVVDVTGQLGGHNFQWAWSSGYVAGRHA